MIAGYTTFSSFPHARGVDARLVANYMPRFDVLAGHCHDPVPAFPLQRDATRDWQGINPSVVAASEWCFFTSECRMVVALVEDAEFGRELKWYFSPGSDGVLDIKDALVLAEQYMDVAIALAGSAPLRDALRGEAAARWQPAPDLVVRSSLFCYTVAPGGTVPPDLAARLRTRPGAWPGTGVFHGAPAGGPGNSLTWDILAGATGVLVIGPGQGGLAIEAPPAITGALGEHLLAIAATQLRLLDRTLASTGVA